ncbi:MAG TPA: TRAP transporter substrate-binding protein [Bradyrhizobium sp.]|nr:TRAP transporter substrate-binding protein [Bradyrhizobium sp.]
MSNHVMFLRGAILGLLLGTLTAATAAQAQTALTLGHNSPIGGPQDIAARVFIAELARTMPHGFSVDVRGGLTVGNDVDIFQATKLGALDMAICATLSFSNQVPAMGVLDLPFLFRDQTHAAHVLDGPIGDELGQSLAKEGLAYLAFGELGIRQLTNSKHTIKTPADLTGLKLRVAPSEIYGLSFKTLGADVVSMGVGEVYAGLRDGRIDGQENPLLVIQANRFDDVQKYVSLSGHFYSALAFFMNAGAFSELSADEQSAIRQAAHAAAVASREAGSASTRKAIVDMRAKGLEVTEEIDRPAFIKALAPAQPEFDRRFGADLIARIRTTP